MPKVSVIVPIYGVERYIERCARSLFEQTLDDMEFIFVDDCSNDDSVKILNNTLLDYPGRKCQVKIVRHEINRGLAAARNTGLDLCTGEYIMHVDSDDYIEFNAAKLLYNFACENNSDIVIFGHYILKNGQRTKCTPVYDKINKIKYIESLLLHHIPASIWNKFYRTEFYKDSGIRSIEGLNHGEDYAVVPRLLYEARNIDILKSALYTYDRSNVNSYTRNLTNKSINNIRQADELLSTFFCSVPDSQAYKRAVLLIGRRSLLVLYSKAPYYSFPHIHDVYQSYLGDCRYLSYSERIVLFLIRNRLYLAIYIIMEFVRIIRKNKV